eukprot:TRINITY_DN4087_c0_g1_i4.p1 TRINITY_DN4087_c0_g1~~TRINITY_DN4087_c0_g1_i4.p1  ORF type:complete len:106 (-),score=2.07 TRINITY_DN4087_c0_g1_i4:67-384(-)
MTSALMIQWITTNFLQYLNRGRTDHSILILDGFGGHKDKISDKKETIRTTFNRQNVRALTLPPNSTGYLQPLDVGVNHPFKERLRALWVAFQKARHRQLGRNGME